MAAAAMAASMFAVDFSATVKMDATIAGKNGDDVDFLTLNKKDQKDNDALIVSANAGKAGAQFQLWYTYDGTDSTSGGAPVTPDVNNPIRIRNVRAWFKPIDMMTVTVGDTNLDSYKEMIFWWHGVYGAKPGSWGAFGGEHLGGNGVKVEVSPIAGLDIAVALLPGVGNPFISTAKDFKIKNYSAKVKYSNIAGLPISAAVQFTDKGAQKLLGIGADYGSPWSGNFYAFLNVNLNMNDDGLQGISFDNYEKFTMNAFQAQAHLPVVLYKSGDKFDVGMYASLKATYALDGFTPYVLITNEPDGDKGWCFDDNFKFSLTVQPGVTFNVGTAAFDIGVRLDMADGADLGWKIPCGITVGL